MMNALLRAAAIVDPNDPDLKNIPKPGLTDVSIAHGMQLVFGAAGGVALLIITIAGFQYVLSQGDPQKIANAKNTIIYALIGLIICIFAFSIVSFVVGRL